MHLISQEVGGRGAFACCILGECNGCCILLKVTAVVRNITFKREMNEPVMVIQTAAHVITIIELCMS